MPPHPQPGGPIEVTAGLLRRGRRLLVSQRRGGEWEFPGGKVEPGETPEEALARELEEELAVRVEVGPLFLSLEHDYPDRRIILHTFWCRLRDGQPKALGVRDFRWVEPEALTGLDLLAADRRVAGRLLEQIGSPGPGPAA